MAKMIEKDGKCYRMRRGKLVEIPPEWVGKITHKSTRRKRKNSWERVAGEERNRVKRIKQGSPES